ncbi:hypothetical protein BC829DRAFT_393751 [Chytridium lagenaria]|nr:hypothetical protein BC829DRAFT_393751 [Chytridium lagenaria]
MSIGVRRGLDCRCSGFCNNALRAKHDFQNDSLKSSNGGEFLGPEMWEEMEVGGESGVGRVNGEAGEVGVFVGGVEAVDGEEEAFVGSKGIEGMRLLKRSSSEAHKREGKRMSFNVPVVMHQKKTTKISPSLPMPPKPSRSSGAPPPPPPKPLPQVDWLEENPDLDMKAKTMKPYAPSLQVSLTTHAPFPSTHTPPPRYPKRNCKPSQWGPTRRIHSKSKKKPRKLSERFFGWLL